MGVDEQERDQAILDTAADLLLRLGYSKLTMGDVAAAVALHRGLVYLRFRSKDELVEAIVLREMNRYAQAWREHLEADPRSGSVASVFRATVHALKTLPMASAMIARDEAVFGKYLRKPDNLFDRVANTATAGTREFLPALQGFLQAMQQAGAMRRDVDARAVAFILDALTPAIRRTHRTGRAVPADPDQPSADELLETVAEMLERTLTPADGADLAAGKAILLSSLEQARTAFPAEPAQQEGTSS